MSEHRERKDDDTAPDSEPSAPRRATLRTPRVAEAVAGQLRRRIIEGDLDSGAELPTEAVLLTEFPASRPSLREAFRILETEGLLVVRRGKRGGTVIKGPTPDTAAYHMGLLLHSRSIPMTDLAVARQLLEPLCAEQAALRPDHEAVGRRLGAVVRETEERLEDGPGFTQASVEFHEALVDAAGNLTLRIIVGMLESVWSTQEMGWAQAAASDESYPDLGLRKRAVRAHAAIATAIEHGDADGVVRLTRKHLEAAQLYVASDPAQSVRILDVYGGSQMQPQHRL